MTARTLSKSLIVQRVFGGVCVIADGRHNPASWRPLQSVHAAGTKRAAAVRQNHKQLGNTPPRQAPDDRKSAPFKGMPFTFDDGRNLNVLVMGSLSCLRSIEFNHDKLMSQIAKRVEDKQLLKLIRAFLNAGVMENGLVSPSVEGTPQGGPLSPLLSNLVLDELDRELERRGHRFVRYADDCNIYVRSERAGQRVMESISRFITQKLKLKVNETKSAVARPQERKFLGFSFTAGPDIKRTIAPKSLERFKQRIRDTTRRAKGVSIKTTMEELATYMVTMRCRPQARWSVRLAVRPLDFVGLLFFGLIIAASAWRRFSMMLGVVLVDCDQICEVLNSIIGERHHAVFTDADDP